jgi:hypothetical protein
MFVAIEAVYKVHEFPRNVPNAVIFSWNSYCVASPEEGWCNSKCFRLIFGSYLV